MHFVLWKTLKSLSQWDDTTINQVLEGESERLEVTKSLLNVLHNIVNLRNIPLTPQQKLAFAEFTKPVCELLNRRQLRAKKRILQANLGLVRLIGQACPTLKHGALFS